MATTPAAEQRKLLDELMGRDDAIQVNRKKVYLRPQLGLRDPKICKTYLVGECPFELFQGTKQSLGRCPQIHQARYKLQYEQDRKRGVEYPEFEFEYLAVLRRFVNESNNLIKQALIKLEHTPEEKKKIRDANEELEILDAQIGLMVKEIDALVQANQLKRALRQGVLLEELRSKRKNAADRVRNITENMGQSAQQKLQVCEVCGAYLSRIDTDRRLADHFLGKVHLGYVKMREEYDYWRVRLSTK